MNALIDLGKCREHGKPDGISIHFTFEGVKILREYSSYGQKTQTFFASKEDIMTATDVAIVKECGMTCDEAVNLIPNIPNLPNLKRLHIFPNMYHKGGFDTECRLDLGKYHTVFGSATSIRGVRIDLTDMNIEYQMMNSIQYFASDPYSVDSINLVKRHRNLRKLLISIMYDNDAQLDEKYIETRILKKTGRVVEVYDA